MWLWLLEEGCCDGTGRTGLEMMKGPVPHLQPLHRGDTTGTKTRLRGEEHRGQSGFHASTFSEKMDDVCAITRMFWLPGPCEAGLAALMRLGGRGRGEREDVWR